MRKPIIRESKPEEERIQLVAESFPETLNACGELIRLDIRERDSRNQE